MLKWLDCRHCRKALTTNKWICISLSGINSFPSLGGVEEHDGPGVVDGADAVEGEAESLVHPRSRRGGVIDLVFWKGT